MFGGLCGNDCFRGDGYSFIMIMKPDFLEIDPQQNLKKKGHDRQDKYARSQGGFMYRVSGFFF